MSEIMELGTYPFAPQQHDRFRSGELWQDWADRYPTIFDSLDVEIAKHQASLGYHFYEWLAAVLIYESMGYVSLVEQYEFRNHTRKQDILRRRVTPELFQLITDHGSRLTGVQCPDLFVYSPAGPEWFFCEVKGPKDFISEGQIVFFAALAKASGQSVRVAHFRQYDEIGRAYG